MARLHTQFLGASTPVSLIEQDIDHYITTHPDCNYDEVLAQDDRWAVFFHLSDMRAGLLGWYDMPDDAETLEIGCGFGALTGALCERSAHVTALSDSLFSARACAKRWNAMENLDVYAGRLRDMPFHQQFDVITLVDILPIVADGEISFSPYIEYLRSLTNYLKPYGRILLAMDNRLGLKFACGAGDPYSNEPFGELPGIVGNGRLFTKADLVEIFSASGFNHWKFYYPLPDYRFPQFVFTDDALPDVSVGLNMIPYDPAPDMRVLSESAMYSDIVRNGLFPAMANSFLIECGMQDDFCRVESVSIAFNRALEYSIATCKENDRFIKKPVRKEAHRGISKIADNLALLRERGLEVIPYELREGELLMPRFDAPTLSDWLKEAKPKDRDTVHAFMERLWAAILQSSPPVADSENCMKRLRSHEDWGVILRRAYLNMTPDNIFCRNGNLVFFNQGLSKENCPAKYQMFLAVYDNMDSLLRIGVLDEIKEHYGLSRLWSTLESIQQENIAEICRYDAYHYFYNWTEMSPIQMMKNRQVLKIIGSEENE